MIVGQNSTFLLSLCMVAFDLEMMVGYTLE